ncbi:MAG TPA: hypothetical protein VHB77_21345 [Planctomycetaceae bacterium]|nr:hypothetical protein [Planctomycetaceae bacterium]
MPVTRRSCLHPLIIPSCASGILLAATLCAMALVCVDASSIADEVPPAERHQHAHWRNPVALVLSDDERCAYVANRRSGSVSVVDLERSAVVAEVEVAGKLNDLVRLTSHLMLATDEERGRLLLLECDGPKVSIVAQLDGLGEPVCVRPTTDGRSCCVTSLWSRLATFVAIENTDGRPVLRRIASMQLPFNPRRLVWLPQARRFVVAEAFGGRLAVLDPQSGKVESVRELPAHNIGDLRPSADGRSLLLTHQILNARASTEFNNVHWGILMSNVVRTIPLTAVCDSTADL